MKPETSINSSTRPAYYFEPIGTLGVNVFSPRVRGLRTVKQSTAEAFGYGDDLSVSPSLFICGVNNEGLNVRGSSAHPYANSRHVDVAPRSTTMTSDPASTSNPPIRPTV